MRPLNKIARVGLWGTAALLLAAAALYFLLPLAINSRPIKEYLARRLAQAGEGRARVGEITLRILPLPNLKMAQVGYALPEKLELQAEAITIYPRFLPLLRGRLVLARVHLQEPVATVQLPEQSGSLDFSALDQRLRSALSDFLRQLPAGTLFALEGGRLQLQRTGRPLALVEGLAGRMRSTDDAFSARLAGRSDWIERFQLQADLEPTTLAGAARLDLAGIDSGKWARALQPQQAQPLLQARIDLSLSLQSRQDQSLACDFSATAPSFILARGKACVAGRRLLLEGAAAMRPDQWQVSLSKLQLAEPALNLQAALQWERHQASPQPRLNLKAHDSDITKIREALLCFFGQNPLWQVVRGGTAVSLEVLSAGDSFAALLRSENLSIGGRAVDARIFLPRAGLDLAEVSGQWRFAKGVLSVQQGSAHFGRSQGRNGSLQLVLQGGPRTLHLEIDLSLDLAQLPPILKRLMKQPAQQQELSNLHALQGSAAGHLSLSGPLQEPALQMQVTEFSLAADYARLPYPLEANGRAASLNRQELTLSQADLRMSGSTVKGLRGRVTLGPEPRIDLRSTQARLAWDELFPWLAAHETFRRTFADLTFAGVTTLTDTHVSGPLNEPQQLQFSSSGSLADFTVRTSRLPEPLTFVQGRFTLLPERLSLTQARMFLMDSFFEGEGSVDGYRRPGPAVALTGRGGIGDRTALWLQRKAGVPERWFVRAPVGITQVKLDWQKEKGLKLQGDFYLPGKLKVACVLSSGPDQLDIEKLDLADEVSSAALSLKHEALHNSWQLHFSGHLENQTLAKLLRADSIYAQQVAGDLRAAWVQDNLAATHLEGKLSARNVLPFATALGNLSLQQLQLEGRERRIHLQQFDIALNGQFASLSGTVELEREALALDLALSAPSLDLSRLQQTRESAARTDAALQEKSAWPALRGRIDATVGQVTYRSNVWNDLKALLLLEKGKTEIQVQEARLCGISTPGNVSWTPREISFEVYPRAADSALQVAALCLTGIPGARIEGNYRVKGRLTTHGNDYQEFVRNLGGELSIRVQKGRVIKAGGVGVLSSLLSYLQINNLITGNLPSVQGEDFVFKRIRMDLEFKEGQAELKRAEVIAQGLNMVGEGEVQLQTRELNLTVLVSPLTTLDTIIRHIPLINRILKGTLVAIPVGVGGRLEDPRFRPLSPTAVGKRLLGIAEGILQTPLRIIEPILPKEQNEP